MKHGEAMMHKNIPTRIMRIVNSTTHAKPKSRKQLESSTNSWKQFGILKELKATIGITC